MSADSRVVDVAVGVLVRADGAVLFGQRPAGKPYAGWWEFPGGKLEAGESVDQALARELHEELGIDVRVIHPWVVREHVYPHAHVRLHFRRIVDWTGSARARESQALAWRHPSAVELAPLLPAAIRVVGWLRLPDRLGISQAMSQAASPAMPQAVPQAMSSGDDAFLRLLDAALARGLRLVQLREPAMPADRLDALFHRMRAACRSAGARLIVNSAHPASYWSAGDGVHLRSDDLHRISARPVPGIVAASCHDVRDIARASALELDFAVLGPAKPTASHPGAPALGWTAFREIAARSAIPVFALGGLDEGDASDAAAAGAHGLAMMRAAWR